jgi:4-diphosphocytidyl-2-C-methyl-D-erythritol kinase
MTMTLELIAPAKINLTLEVTVRRPDGYHEIVSVMQTIDLADCVRLRRAPSLQINVSGERRSGSPVEGSDNLAFKAAQALAEAAGILKPGALIELEKNIPAGMGLGGGSSDAAAVLHGLCRLWRLDLDPAVLNDVAASIGSDVPFFLSGGSALVTGRGERIEPLPDIAPLTLTLFRAALEVEDKTRRMYATLTASDFTDGSRSRAMADSIRAGLPVPTTGYYNAFDRYIGTVSGPLAEAMTLCREAGVTVIASGSGPSFFSPTPLEELPDRLLAELERRFSVSATACHSLSRSQATAMTEV